MKKTMMSDLSDQRRQFLRNALTVAGIGLVLGSASPRRLLAEALSAKAGPSTPGLGALFAGDFKVGTALSNTTLLAQNPELEALVSREFSAITAENAMKWEEVHPQADTWDWQRADHFVDFGHRKQMYTIGHTLVWHSQIPESVFVDTHGRLRKRGEIVRAMETHIGTLAGRYRGKIQAWDVVNEAVTDDGQWRKSLWYNTLGDSYFSRAFHLAREADPGAELLYNDYSMHLPAKRDGVIDKIAKLRKQGMPIHGVGMQAHVHLDDPAISELEASIEAIAAVGLDVHITELDVDVLPKAYDYMGAEISTNFAYSEELNPFPEQLPEKLVDELAARYESLFKLFLKHRDKVRRVSLWGTTDAESWKNDWPVVGRTNYPLIFDREGEPKKAYYAVAGLKGGASSG
ncbi:endo-1,4-beta-xylanase [Microbulbifer bruguierae]|uniref:Beta-xylanase n=1 Tax=Microbulbifer bruguierae TaxID=3029061 RepID=A0ABY8NHA5_9GAMM|nr:endo-1,4-beta-xylanase [Microbulbifer bruguierae]WGL18311.1 endo-1,4-beta-xylanase [Microbulbifer bruguierae]